MSGSGLFLYTRQNRLRTETTSSTPGRVTQEFFDKQAATRRLDQEGLLRKIHDIENAPPAPVDLFIQQPAAEQRRLFQLVVEKAAWKDGALRTAL